MTSTEKLIKKEFKLNSKEEIFSLIDSKNDSFFKDNYNTDRVAYLKMIKRLIASINDDGEHYSQYLEMARSGSIIAGNFTSSAVGFIKTKYQENRKKLVTHARLLITSQ
jgi:hypothetical protein